MFRREVKEKVMPKGVKHYFKDGTEHKGGMHKMPNGEMHSGARHNSNSKPLVHFGKLSKSAKAKARKGWR
jgi:hypothetical protein